MYMRTDLLLSGRSIVMRQHQSLSQNLRPPYLYMGVDRIFACVKNTSFSCMIAVITVSARVQKSSVIIETLVDMTVEKSSIMSLEPNRVTEVYQTFVHLHSIE